MNELMDSYQTMLNLCLDKFKFRTQELTQSEAKEIVKELQRELSKSNIKAIRNDKALEKIISRRLDEIVVEYMGLMHANKINQNRQLELLHNGMDITEMKDIEYSKVDVHINDITRNVTDSVITHINFENRETPLPYDISRNVERIVSKIISEDRLRFINSRIDKICEAVLEQMKQEKNYFSKEYYKLSNPKKEPQKSTSKLRTEVKNGKLYTYDEYGFVVKVEELGELSPEGVFDEPHESENAKLFR